MKTICVFCGARKGTNPEIEKITYEIGLELARRKIDIICGGSDCGLMGVITDAALKEGGKVVGVFPAILNDVEVPHKGLTDLLRTPCLGTRKKKMVEASDAFLILPGGYGTLDEIFEIVVLRRLNANQKPIILFNYNGFWDCTLKQIERMAQEGFVGKEESSLFTIIKDFSEFKALMSSFF